VPSVEQGEGDREWLSRTKEKRNRQVEVREWEHGRGKLSARNPFAIGGGEGYRAMEKSKRRSKVPVEKNEGGATLRQVLSRLPLLFNPPHGARRGKGVPIPCQVFGDTKRLERASVAQPSSQGMICLGEGRGEIMFMR